MAVVGIVASAAVGVAANGWSVTASPGPLKMNPELSGVSCTSATDCTGVGWFVDSSGLGRTLVVRGSGSSWARVASPTPPSPGGALVAVSCASASDCLAVGTQWLSVTGYGSVTLAERWDGSHWAIVPSPNPPGVGVAYTQAALDGVSCASATSCLAVGFYSIAGIRQTLAERWDGTAWTIVSSPNPGGDNSATTELSSVSCLNAMNCYAVGYSQTSVWRTLVEHWNGTTWAISPSVNPAPNYLNVLSGISCPSAANCFAVGYYSPFGGASHTLIEHWNGSTWKGVPSQGPPGASLGKLSSVSCASATSCVAVGSFATSSGSNSTVQQPLVLQRNASPWSVVPSAKPLASGSWLSGSSCSTVANCVGVGSLVRDGLFHTLIEGP